MIEDELSPWWTAELNRETPYREDQKDYKQQQRRKIKSINTRLNTKTHQDRILQQIPRVYRVFMDRQRYQNEQIRSKLLHSNTPMNNNPPLFSRRSIQISSNADILQYPFNRSKSGSLKINAAGRFFSKKEQQDDWCHGQRKKILTTSRQFRKTTITREQSTPFLTCRLKQAIKSQTKEHFRNLKQIRIQQHHPINTHHQLKFQYSPSLKNTQKIFKVKTIDKSNHFLDRCLSKFQ